MAKKRVVVTGRGTINPLGNNVNDFCLNAFNGHSGITNITQFDVSEYKTKIAGTVKNFNTEKHFSNKEAKKTSNFILYAAEAALQAVHESNLDIEKSAERIGVEIGSGIGGLSVLEKMVTTLNEKGPSKVSPFTVPMMIPDMASGFVSIKLGAKGPNSSSVTACASATHSIGNSFRIIQNGDADAMICGGSEAPICPIGLAAFSAAKTLCQENEFPEKASKPFDLARNGFVMGEGAGIIILEELEYALKRNAKIFAEVIGYGSAGDAYHITAPAPHGEGAQRTIMNAIKDAQISPNEIDHINAHGTSTQLNDKNETEAYKNVFKDHAPNIKICSSKSMTGHLLGAAGAIELILAIDAIENQRISPTINLNTPDPDCDLDYTPNKGVSANVNIAMSNNFGFGGHNAGIILKNFKN